MLLEGILSVLTPACFVWNFFGTFVGIIFGAIPGLSAVMAMVLFLPMSFGLEPYQGIALLLGLYVGGISGGMISAILIKIPGTPASMCTVFDGGPMADRGEAGKALGIGVLYYEDGRRDCRIELLSTRLIKSRLFQTVEF